MAQTDRRAEWLEALREAGCGEALHGQIAELLARRETGRAGELLRRHKRLLLEELHVCQAKVDLTDYLIYQLKRLPDRPGQERTVWK